MLNIVQQVGGITSRCARMLRRDKLGVHTAAGLLEHEGDGVLPMPGGPSKA